MSVRENCGSTSATALSSPTVQPAAVYDFLNTGTDPVFKKCLNAGLCLNTGSVPMFKFGVCPRV